MKTQFVIKKRADWYHDPINLQRPHATENVFKGVSKTGHCKFFSNAVVIGKYRNKRIGPFNDGLMLPCTHLCLLERCQSLDGHGLCPIRIKKD